ncbi:hypothetical protein FJT64_007119 [Amphibalanus amphitrite]|uniref:Uncharacterized protein n=1 Tax=Amphibalanus amphitrite TaxID=1232801 RepID=A0A6A4VVA4_AMPAM|nr:hypothetical protein FJT64_007119 [Amphibalanus amphitrite]
MQEGIGRHRHLGERGGEVETVFPPKEKTTKVGVLLEEKEPTYLSATTLDLDHEPPVEPEVPDADVTAVENLVTARQPCPGPAASAGAAPPPASLPSGATGVASLSRQALAYVAGYVAAKCATVDSTLGKITSDASEVPRDERYAWIDTLSRGGLTVPSARWLDEVEQLEVLFTTMHGGDVDRGPGVVRRLAEAAALKFPQLHPYVLRKYAMTRTQLRALAYVAGYVAAKCATVDSTLGKITSDASEVPRDERYAWIDTLSRGGLTVPSARWLDEVEQLEVLFTTMHGGDVDRGPGVVRRLAEAAALKFPQLHPYVLRKYAMTRTQLRVREIRRLIGDRERLRKEQPTCSREAKRARLYVHPGFVVKKTLDSVSCSTCQEALVSDIQPDDMTQLYHLFIISAR